MASNKNLPLIAGGIAALFLLMGGKAKASTSTKSTEDTVTEIPPSDAPNSDIPQQDTKPSGGTKPVNPGPVTTLEKQNASIAINYAAEASDFFPNPYNQKSPGQSNLDWATNVTFWLTYSFGQSFCSKYDPQQFCSQPYSGELVPYKLTKSMKKVDGKDFAYWSKVWVRIRNYLKATYPEILQ